ncbi:hypothetical protein BH20GEM1_BH20GEM1_18000 [soil metagenome]
MESTLEKLYDQIEDIQIAMMTTRRPDGHLESRAMATQKRATGADLWFVTKEDTAKLRDIGGDRTREWVSVSGIATPTRDRAKIHELYAPDWKMWFAEGGATRGTGPRTTRAWS